MCLKNENEMLKEMLKGVKKKKKIPNSISEVQERIRHNGK